MLNYIAGREKVNKEIRYLICHYAYNKVSFEMVTEKGLLTAMQHGLKIENAVLADGTIKGNPASLARFDKQPRPYIVLARLATETDQTIGYYVATPAGKAFKARNDKILEYCNQVLKVDGVPFQNAIFIADSKDSSFIKSYPDCPFPVEVMKQAQNKRALAPTEAKIEKPKHTNELEEALKNDDLRKEADEVASRYTKEQKAQLKLGLQHNVNIWNYADPEISWQKMKVLRLAMERGFNVTPLCIRKYIVPVDINALIYAEMCLEQGIDIRNFINPEYTVFQLQELYTGLIHYIDINEYSDPKLSVAEMTKIRERLEYETWNTEIGPGGV